MRPIRSLILPTATLALLMTAGCSERSEESRNATVDVAAENAAAPAVKAAAADRAEGSSSAPGLTTSAAPGVAFAYRYAFTMPTAEISGVQQQHAAACEKLGPASCQVTGMSFEQRGDDQAEGRLDFMVAPGIAHTFGKDATELVEKAQGTLANANVTGDNAGARIDESQRRSATIRAELDRLGKRLGAGGLTAEERRDLTARVDEMRSELQSLTESRHLLEASLATTPMSFAYASEGLFAGGKDPFGKAAASSLGSLESTLAFLLTAAGLALPWLLLAGMIALLVRYWKLKQRLTRIAEASATPAAPASPAAAP